MGSNLDGLRDVLLPRRIFSRKLIAVLLVTACLTAAGCGGGSSDGSTPVSTPTLASISISGASPVVDTGTVQFTATAKDSNGNTMSGVSFSWASSNASYATINNGSGLATAVAPGVTQITASAQGVTSSPFALTVTTGAVAAITVSGASSVTVNSTDQFTAAAKDSAGYAISGVTFTWASSNTSYASINSSGLATGASAGTTQITASASGITSAPFGLTVTAATVPTSLSFGGLTTFNSLGLPLTPAVTVSVLDQNGHVDSSASGSVTMALGTNPTNATLAGTLQATVSSGVATFSNLSFNYPGVGYTLTASFAGVPNATSSAFTVLPSHSSVLSLEGQEATVSNWYTHSNASFTATASTAGTLLLPSLESDFDNGVAVPWSTEPQETVSYSNLASTPHTIALTGQTQSGSTVASTLTWEDCANTDTATSQPMADTASTCATLTIPQSPAAGGFSGFADPTIRKDPSTGTVWLGYSWPHAWNPGANSTDAVDLYLTSSSDNGVTWGTPTALWTSSLTTDPSNGNSAYTSNEILNILPGQVTGQTGETWFSIHLTYYVDVHTSIVDALVPTSAMVLTWAPTPTGLATAPAAQTFTFTANGASPMIPANVNLTTLDSSLANCQQWGEPALLMKNGNLYMALMCKYGTSATSMQPAKNFYGVFEATPNLSEPPAQWNWQYNGVLAGPTQAALLEGHQFLYELDLATRADGAIIASVSPADDVPNGSGGSTQYVYGCRELLVQGLDKGNIGLATDSNGQLEVLASITASDVGPTNNDSASGACTYDPQTSNGVVFVRQLSSDTRFPGLGFYAGIYSTDVMP